MFSNFALKRNNKKSKQGSSLPAQQKKMASDFSQERENRANYFHPQQQKVAADFIPKTTADPSSQRKVKRPDFSTLQTQVATDLGLTEDLDIDALLKEIDRSHIKNETGKHKSSKASKSKAKSWKAKKSDKTRYITNDEGSFSGETKQCTSDEFRYIQSDEDSFAEDTKHSNANEFRYLSSDFEGCSSEASEETKQSTVNENPYLRSEDEGSFSEEAIQSASDKFRYSTSDDGSSSEETKPRISMFLV